MINAQPLSDLEMYEIIKLAYPEKFPETEDDDWDDLMDFVEDLGGFDEVSDLLGRVARLAPVMQSPLSGANSHCLGEVKIKDGQVLMRSVVQRKYED